MRWAHKDWDRSKTYSFHLPRSAWNPWTKTFFLPWGFPNWASSSNGNWQKYILKIQLQSFIKTQYDVWLTASLLEFRAPSLLQFDGIILKVFSEWLIKFNIALADPTEGNEMLEMLETLPSEPQKCLWRGKDKDRNHCAIWWSAKTGPSKNDKQASQEWTRVRYCNTDITNLKLWSGQFIYNVIHFGVSVSCLPCRWICWECVQIQKCSHLSDSLTKVR